VRTQPFQHKKDYQPIENYGVIGDLNTVAVVGLNGSIDFMCFPNFDSPTIFASLLDCEKGGSFKIAPATNDIKEKQLYIPDTNILLTRFLSHVGIAEVTDFMPIEERRAEVNLIRMVTCVHGQLDFEMTCSPRFDYARSRHSVEKDSEYGISFIPKDGRNSLRLFATVQLAVNENDACARFTLRTGEKAIFVLELKPDGDAPFFALEEFAQESLFKTIKYWKDWTEKGKYRGRWMDIVNRSALVLKLMTSHKYGSIVASPTFGLPEEIGGVRNWDYRYTWIRDASFTIYTLLKLGYIKEARRFISWVEKQCKDIDAAGELRLMYTIDGRQELGESELNHFEGYRGSTPVRIGNDAYNQIQMDIYGELLDAVYLYDKHAEPISYAFWLDISKQVNWVCDHWRTADEGIWEVRGGKKEFLYSRMMCWVAVDRAMKVAEAHSYPLDPRWRDERDKMFYSIHTEFWNEKLQCFVQYRGADTVDAATLLMPLVRFIGPKDPRWLSTLERIEQTLVSDSLVYRYRADENIDGIHGGEGTFSMCTFWYVECLSKSGQLSKARLYFEKMLGYANHVGLYAEQLGLQGQHLGNFPQAFTHLGLISAALSLDSQFSDERNRDEFNV
jgi:GH15 family glucan-1,4-alpha-glucosidase